MGAYLLGRRSGLLIAILSVLLIIAFATVYPSRFFTPNTLLQDICRLCSWTGFLILASITVGSLYEMNRRQLHDLQNAYVGILEILSKYLESTDRDTKGHSVRVSELAMDIAIAMELYRTDVENIRVAGLLHDIGKVEVSGEILRKAADLTTEEKDEIDKHAEKGAMILSSVGSVLKEVVPIVMAHHEYFSNNENLDNDALKERKIPLGARILAVADAFDAMTTDRPYRKGMPPWQAREQIMINTGKQFDPQVVEAFKRVLDKKLETI
ncbi:MAG: HD domain-containing protein [Deltaproteobacteria bacterium]|nr:HD domain-containing protein [Deltaproteobacteria bacterium]